nr:MAG TPA: hypothetical protein [Caudoviricetes sp.]
MSWRKYLEYVLIKQEIHLNIHPFLKCIIYKNI